MNIFSARGLCETVPLILNTFSARGQQADSRNGSDECKICYEATVDCVLYMCGHMCLCYEVIFFLTFPLQHRLFSFKCLLVIFISWSSNFIMGRQIHFRYCNFLWITLLSVSVVNPWHFNMVRIRILVYVPLSNGSVRPKNIRIRIQNAGKMSTRSQKQ
jgi:hypothetical protein